MRQRRALRQAGGAAGVLQEQQVVAVERRPGSKVKLGAFGQRIGEADGAGQPCVDRRAGDGGAAAVAEADGDDRLDRRSWPMTSATVADTPLKTTMVSTPASLSWCSSSRGVYSGLTLTCTAPARTMPSKAIGKASRLGTSRRCGRPSSRRACPAARRRSRATGVDVGVGQRLPEAANRRRSAKRGIAFSKMATTER